MNRVSARESQIQEVNEEADIMLRLSDGESISRFGSGFVFDNDPQDGVVTDALTFLIDKGWVSGFQNHFRLTPAGWGLIQEATEATIREK